MDALSIMDGLLTATILGQPTSFPRFTLDFHIPYYVLKMAEAPIEDTRKKADGNPLRQAFELPFLSTSMNQSKPAQEHCYLYEAQVGNRKGVFCFLFEIFS
jgi:hypothetical protein